MGLVSYSDSEGSENEESPNLNSPQAKQGKSYNSSKGNFQKAINRSVSNKIRVNLPDISKDSRQNVTSTDIGVDEPPAKRARTDGGAFGGFNSFLPAPKNPSKRPHNTDHAGGGGGLLRNKGGKLEGAVSLKTGPTPAFSREGQHAPTPAAESTGDHVTLSAAQDQEEDIDTKIGQKQEIKLVGNVNRFRPLSVSRKPAAKTKKPSSEAAKPTPSTTSTKPNHVSNTAAHPELKPEPPIREKRSLFSNALDDTGPLNTASDEAYEPVMGDDNIASIATSHIQTEPSSSTQSDMMTKTNASQTPDLESLANKLGLSASERRQLFGRGGKPTNTQVAQFSLAAEYSHNNELLQNEANAMPQHNPVRSIAPGKHSLQQLVNAANNQKDALEESFAEGKRNKAAAGKKYGW